MREDLQRKCAALLTEAICSQDPQVVLLALRLARIIVVYERRIQELEQELISLS